jgi:hypothetical protein
MMKRLTPYLLAVLLVAASACAPSMDSPSTSDDMDAPVSSDDPSAPPADTLLPQPADAALQRENAYLDSAELLIMESYPLQFMLVLQGSLPTPCNQLRVSVSPPDAENKIVIDVYSLRDPALMCTEVIQPFSENVPLGSFPAGKYTLWVNGEKVAEFDA